MSQRRGGRARHQQAAQDMPARSEAYRQLRHPFEPQKIFSDDAIHAIHMKALRLLEELGIKILLPEARAIFKAAGAKVDNDSLMVNIGADIVEAARETAPRSIRMRAASKAREQRFEPGAMLFMAGSGCPNITNMKRGREGGTAETFKETIQLQQAFDVIHVFGPSAEPQDVPTHLRHYEMTRTQLLHGDKPMFAYARGTRQVEQCFELVRLGLDLDDDDFTDGVWMTTIINTNSPRQIDIPMAQGVIDFARHRQLLIITPFCLAGAMAPISVAGALVLQHAEALACITLCQLVNPGAPVSYGGFASNVDMKSGSPAFGTPTHINIAIGSGQMARYLDLPWRSASGAASNVADMQAAGETHMGLWGTVLANATITVHGAGWLEGGLSFGYEKFINDIEALNTLAELCAVVPEDEDSLAWSALADVQPGGHFFATGHTMDRYRDAFYEPLVADLSNHGSWQEAGGKTSSERACEIWQQVLNEAKPPAHGERAIDAIDGRIEEWSRAGGAPPLSG